MPDDPGAIIVIALFFSDQLSKSMLGFAAAGIGLLFVPSGLRVQRIWPYVVVGLFLWGCVLKSGVHATLAGGDCSCPLRRTATARPNSWTMRSSPG